MREKIENLKLAVEHLDLILYMAEMSKDIEPLISSYNRLVKESDLPIAQVEKCGLRFKFKAD